jgi:hypothetical protein
MADAAFKRKLAAILSAGVKGFIGNNREAKVRTLLADHAAIYDFA